MYRIKDKASDEFLLNKSRFITYLQRVETEDEAAAFISEIKKLHPKATHHCQATLINENIQGSNDDGEPSGTAGLPMLEILRKKNMELIAAVVVRYYGGVKLGAGGLIRAYSKGVNDTLNKIDIYQVVNMDKYSLTVEYQYADIVEHLLKDKELLEKDYQMDVTFTYLNNDESFNDKINEVTSGQALIEKLGNIEIEIIKKETDND